MFQVTIMRVTYLLFITINLLFITFAKSTSEDADKTETASSDVTQNSNKDRNSDETTTSSNVAVIETAPTTKFDSETTTMAGIEKTTQAADKTEDKTTQSIVNNSTEIDETEAFTYETTTEFTTDEVSNNYEIYETNNKKKNSNSKKPGNKFTTGLKLLFSAIMNMLKGNKKSYNEPQENSDTFNEYSDYNYKYYNNK